MKIDLEAETIKALEEVSRGRGMSIDDIVMTVLAPFTSGEAAWPGDLDWKKFEFVTTVQTGMIQNAINLSLEPDAREKRAAFSSPTAVYKMSEAFRAAELIPDELTARQAAHAFTHWLLHNRTDPSAKMPSWFGPPTAEDEARWDRGDEAS